MPFEVKKLDKYEQGGVLDAQVRDFLNLLAQMNVPPLESMTPSEARESGQRLQSHGVPVQCSRYNGMIHDFFLLLGLVDRARDAMDEACNSLRDALFG
ncbi:MAG: hypothetical protein WBD99_16045 [Thermodesulfobacteriota bacterium]